MSTQEANRGTQLTIADYCGTVHDALDEAQAKYDAQFHEPDWDSLEPCVTRLVTFPDHDWDNVESCVSRVVEFPDHDWDNVESCVSRVVEFPDHDWTDTTPCVRKLTHDEKVHGIGHDWDALESVVRRLSGLEKLLGQSVFTEQQHAEPTRYVRENTSEQVRAATADAHDYSDCGGDQA